MGNKFFRKHIVHGLIFMLAGLFLLGSYVIFGVNTLEDSVSIGPFIALCMFGFGLYLVVHGNGLLEEEKLWVEYYDAIFVAVGLALLIRTFVIEPFKIPSGSMIPTLLVGDYLFVNKFSYGYRVPFTRHRILMSDGPHRGDVAVFEYPMNPDKDYVKRIIGLPGDRLVYSNKRLTVNGIAVPYIDKGPYNYSNSDNRPVAAQLLIEQMDGRDHSIIVESTSMFAGRQEVIVPPDNFFVLGDNRDNSNDSRFWGFVPKYRLVGRAIALFWSWDSQQESFTQRVRWERAGSAIR